LSKIQGDFGAFGAVSDPAPPALAVAKFGAVNTGTITSGVNAAVQGIVGMTGQASSGL
jgi:hypothetical protein